MDSTVLPWIGFWLNRSGYFFWRVSEPSFDLFIFSLVSAE